MSGFEVTQDLKAHACAVRLNGDVDTSVVPGLRKELGGAIESGCTNIVLDLTEVDYADSSALGLLVWLDHRLHPASGKLVLVGANRDVARVFELSGLVLVASSVSMSATMSAAFEGLELQDTAKAPLWTRSVDIEADVNCLGHSRENVVDILEPLGLPDSSLFDVKVAVGEALANAVRHGVPASGEHRVRVNVLAYEDRVVLEIMDNGPGFSGVAEDSDDLYAPGGRGVMFMNALMDRVQFEESPWGGTMVRLVKHRPAGR